MLGCAFFVRRHSLTLTRRRAGLLRLDVAMTGCSEIGSERPMLMPTGRGYSSLDDESGLTWLGRRQRTGGISVDRCWHFDRSVPAADAKGAA